MRKVVIKLNDNVEDKLLEFYDNEINTIDESVFLTLVLKVVLIKHINLISDQFERYEASKACGSVLKFVENTNLKLVEFTTLSNTFKDISTVYSINRRRKNLYEVICGTT